jgi:hypothetical protein
MQHFAKLAVAGLLAASGCGEHHGDADAPPSAPTNLAVTLQAGGAHLTWTDTSDNEDHFMIMRKESGGVFDDIDTVTFNTAQYHDGTVTAGTTYVFMVVAMNAKGVGNSNEVTFSY